LAPAELTDGEWERVRPLLPPQRPATGRPRHDHRTLLSGILWVMRTRASWRDMPIESGHWETACKRYRLWHDTGLWQRLLAILGDAYMHKCTSIQRLPTVSVAVGGVTHIGPLRVSPVGLPLQG
jgi:transposase